MLERGEHLSLNAVGARHELIGFVAALLGVGEQLGDLGVGLGVAVGERLLEPLAVGLQLALEAGAHGLAVAAGLGQDALGARARLFEVGPCGLAGLVEHPLALAQELLGLELGGGLERRELVGHERVHRADRALDGQRAVR